MKTLIAVPCMDQVAAPFAQSLATLDRGDGEVMVSMIIGSLIYESRNNFCKQAIKVDADYVMWFDSDMIFDPDTMQKLIKHMQDGKDIVSGLYFRRRPPFTPVLFKELVFNEETGERHHAGYDNYPKDSLFEIQGCGFGCVMVKKEVLLDVLMNCQTWFDPLGGYGEDLSFCIRAMKCGYKIWCDSSIKCGHVGQTIINEPAYEATLTGPIK